MNPEIFANWLRLQGHNVIKTKSSYWYDAGPKVYQAFPYHWVIQPSEDEIMELLCKNRIICLRYSTGIESKYGCISYHVIYDGAEYTLESIERRSRQNVSKGLKKCRVEKIEVERLVEEGWYLETDTAKRQNRRIGISKDDWRRKYSAANNLAGFEAWGALIGNRLVASILCIQMEDTIELISQQCHSDFLKDRVNNALAYTVTEAMIKRPVVRSVFYTLESLDANDSVDEFKFRMGYRAKPVRQRVVFHPWLKPISDYISWIFGKKLVEYGSEKNTISKVKGMLNLYIKGNKPISKQVWPECLIRNKEELLKRIRAVDSDV